MWKMAKGTTETTRGGKCMPIYKFKCRSCGKTQELLVKMMQKTTECKDCGGLAEYQLSFNTVSIGLPNGHIAIKRRP